MYDSINQRFWIPVFDNDIDALIPEFWAQEALMVLEANALAANMVHRDFEPIIAQYGDTVNAHRPSKHTARRKGVNDDVVMDDVDVENIPVILNQHLYDSFIIKDGEESKSFKSLVEMHLVPSIEAINQAIDLLVLTQLYHFMDNAVGKLGTALTKTAAIAVETKMNQLLIPKGQRWGLVTATQKGEFSNVDQFTDADKIGDDGTAIREGSLGKLYGTNWVLSDNAPSIAAGNTTYATALTADEPIGETVLAVTAFAAEHDGHPGGWLTVAGDMTPQKILSVDNTAETITISPGLKYACASTAVVTIYVPGALDEAHAVGRVLPISYDGFTVSPQQGQLMSFSDQTTPEAWGTGLYGSLQGPTTTAALLDVPVQNARINNDIVGIGPAGQYGFCFHPHAIALVTRPLALPREGTGAQGFVASYNGLSIRVVITYNPVKQGHMVTVDLLCGIKVLNTDLGVPLLS